ncbi:MAG: MBL fold metallo-hydrolase [Emergencia sp.]
MKIRRFIGGSLESNGYILYQREGGSCIVIDPGYSPKKFISFIREHGLRPEAILLTHLHHDHTGAAEAVRDAFDCPVCMHEEDAFVYRGRVDRTLTDGDTFDLEGETLRILHTPGHTRGSICIMAEKSRMCFTGDTIFDTDLGRTDLDGGSEEDMKRSIRSVVDTWSNDITIFPGHDDGCTMKQVRNYNREFLALRDGNER